MHLNFIYMHIEHSCFVNRWRLTPLAYWRLRRLKVYVEVRPFYKTALRQNLTWRLTRGCVTSWHINVTMTFTDSLPILSSRQRATRPAIHTYRRPLRLKQQLWGTWMVLDYIHTSTPTNSYIIAPMLDQCWPNSITPMKNIIVSGK